MEEKLSEKMDLERTDKLFDSSIARSGSHDKGIYTEEDIKRQRLVIGFGNLHINTARVKMAAIRMIGYRDNNRRLKVAVEKRAKRELRDR